MNILDWLFTKIVWALMLGLFGVGALLMFVTAAAIHDVDALALGFLFLGIVLLAILKLLDWSAHRHAKAAKEPMATFVLTFSRVSLVLLSGAYLSLAAACAIPIAEGIDDPTIRLVAWVGLLAFAGAAIALPIQKRFVTLTMSPYGLDYTSFQVGPISWRDIGDVSISRLFRTESVALQIADEEKYLGRRSSPIKRWLRWRIVGQAFDVSPQWLAKAIQLRIDHFGKTASTNPPTVQRQGTPA
jgi:hypothetical protein